MDITKLYCYVDESGQDTEGKMFVVATIIVEKDRDEILFSLEKIENESGKHKRKWINTRQTERDKSNSLLRLSDSIVGLVRDDRKSVNKLIKERIINEL